MRRRDSSEACTMRAREATSSRCDSVLAMACETSSAKRVDALLGVGRRRRVVVDGRHADAAPEPAADADRRGHARPCTPISSRRRIA